MAYCALSAPASISRSASAADTTGTTPTSVVHRSMCDSCFYGPYASLRAKLDFTYHANYTEERQSDQDKLVTEVLSSGVCTALSEPCCLRHTLLCTPRAGVPSDKPWIVYTAGAMGVGKSWTMRWLQRNGYFPLNYFVHIDPDALKVCGVGCLTQARRRTSTPPPAPHSVCCRRWKRT